jgi:DNA polymerase III gamma/tau subunit
VLGLVGRDLLLDTVQAVVDEDASQAFALAARAVEMGYDLRAVCRELSRVVRDLLVLSVDPSRISDPEIAGEGERDRLIALSARFSREDLLRAFDLLTRTEAEIRGAAQPRYNLEMALLRWIHLRKLVPIESLIQAVENGASLPRNPASRNAGGRQTAAELPPATAAPASAPASARSSSTPVSGSGRTSSTPSPSSAPASSSRPGHPGSTGASSPPAVGRPGSISASPSGRPGSVSPATPESAAAFKDALLAEIRKGKVVFYQTVVAQAQKIEVTGDRVTFTFAPNQRALPEMFEQHRSWLESVAHQLSGRKIALAAVQGDPAAAVPPGDAAVAAAAADRKSALREQALADAGVQAMLEVFPAEIRDVEEM